MGLSEADKALLRQVASSASFSDAVALIPEDWMFFVSTVPSEPLNRCHAALVPTGLHADHSLVRLSQQGLAFGRGPTRHAALVNACHYVLRRTQGKIDISLLNLVP